MNEKSEWKDIDIEDKYLINNYLHHKELLDLIGQPIFLIQRGGMEETSDIVLNHPIGKWVILDFIKSNFTNNIIYSFTCQGNILQFYEAELGKYFFPFKEYPSENFCKVIITYEIVKGQYCRNCQYSSNNKKIHSKSDRANKGKEHMNEYKYGNYGTCSLFEDMIIYHEKIDDFEKCDECKLRTQFKAE